MYLCNEQLQWQEQQQLMQHQQQQHLLQQHIQQHQVYTQFDYAHAKYTHTILHLNHFTPTPVYFAWALLVFQ